MADAMKRTIPLADNFGIVGFFMDAKNDRAKKFYEGYGFVALQSNPLALFLPLATLVEASNS